MSFVNDNKVYIAVIFIVIIITAYYLIDYQIKNTLFSELKKIGEKKARKIKLQKIKQHKNTKKQYSEEQSDQNNQQYDMDSYIDPAAKYIQRGQNNEDDYDEEQEMKNRMQQERLSKDDIYMRDLMDK